MFYFVSALAIQGDFFTIANKQLKMENDEKIKLVITFLMAPVPEVSFPFIFSNITDILGSLRDLILMVLNTSIITRDLHQ